jgi:hypothetical protein
LLIWGESRSKGSCKALLRPLPAFARIFALPQYAFKDIQKPIGISTYRVTRELPEPLQAEVPSIEDLEGIVEQLHVGFDDARETQDGREGER